MELVSCPRVVERQRASGFGAVPDELVGQIGGEDVAVQHELQTRYFKTGVGGALGVSVLGLLAVIRGVARLNVGPWMQEEVAVIAFDDEALAGNVARGH